MPRSGTGTDRMTIAWHYTSGTVYDQVRRDGCLKSRALLLAEELKARPDWKEIKDDREKILAAIPLPYRNPCDLYLAPVVWFSRRQHWDGQAAAVPELQYVGENAVALNEHTHQGLFRFGMPASKLLGWYELKERYDYSPMWRLLWTLRNRTSKDVRETWVLGYEGESLPLDEVERVETYEVGQGWRPIASEDALHCLTK